MYWVALSDPPSWCKPFSAQLPNISGRGLKHWTEKRVDNVKRIFESAERKLGDKIDTEGSVPPRVLKGILDDGSFCEDRLGAEYFGGVLASSRSTVSRDDRGASIVALLSRLTTYQIRTHYVLYSLTRNLFMGHAFETLTDESLRKLSTFVPLTDYLAAMDFSPGEDFNIVMTHSLFGLHKESLIGTSFNFGSVDYIKSHYDKASSAGLIYQPSVLGIELFLWAHGKGEMNTLRFLDSLIEFAPVDDINLSANAQRIHEPPTESKEMVEPQ